MYQMYYMCSSSSLLSTMKHGLCYRSALLYGEYFRTMQEQNLVAKHRVIRAMYVTLSIWLSLDIEKNCRITYIPRTVTLVTSILGGCVFTWQTYNPRSSLRTPAIASLQLFGYWKLTLYLGSEMWVVLPRVKRDAQSALRRNHMTYNCDTDSTVACDFAWGRVRLEYAKWNHGASYIGR